MGGDSAKELSDELNRLMMEQIESVKKQTFVGLDEKELRQQEDRLKRIREISADFLAALQSELPGHVKGEARQIRKDKP
jgi:hypothetical protein